ncbi:Retrotransposon-derived protein PEG10 [Rhizoctonia solani]|uniref:Retrotransposon-derived protein PEG10 n=1 Tax=Rhizoctonia solani TaxID=456999 RepID=A0A8H8P4E5_9AGAM|nr:Retrotransposon-derived protein PEG10 [Rhizoctonia solani]QRW24950.1 Retrotransposon-derived protein PEG10 [Rhizoctonia solani]
MLSILVSPEARDYSCTLKDKRCPPAGPTMQCAGGTVYNQAATISSTSINACHLTDLDTFPPNKHYTPADSCSRPGSPHLGSCSKTYLLQSPRTPPLFESIDNSTQPDELLDLCDNSSAGSDSDSDSDDPCLTTCSPCLDVDYFGKYLMNLSVSGATRPAPLPLGNDPLPSDAKEPHHDDPYIEDDDNADTYPDNPDNPDNPDDPEGVLVEEPPIRVPPDDAKGPPGPPGNDAGAGMPLFDAHPTLRNIYLRTWAQYAFNHATQDSVQAILESHKLALMANAQYLPQPLVKEI